MKTSIKKIMATALTALTLSVASYVYAAGSIVEIVYYSDASYSTIVGEQVNNSCTGSRYISGTITSYAKVVNVEPCGIRR